MKNEDLQTWIGAKISELLERRAMRRQFHSVIDGITTISPTNYWSGHTVLADQVQFANSADSLESFCQRNWQYSGYLDLMPVEGFDDLSILDYGCGPGHDLVGFAEFSNAERIVGVDVSPRSVDIATQRLELHSKRVEIFLVSELDPLSRFGDGTFDYIHCSGVLHHLANPREVLKEFRRILRSGGRARVMVYNEASVWFHLYAGFVLPKKWKVAPENLQTETVFRMSTDGPNCPISIAYTKENFCQLASDVGLHSRVLGTAISQFEVDITRRYLTIALQSQKLPERHREFLEKLKFCDELPVSGDLVAGINLVFDLTLDS